MKNLWDRPSSTPSTTCDQGIYRTILASDGARLSLSVLPFPRVKDQTTFLLLPGLFGNIFMLASLAKRLNNRARCVSLDWRESHIDHQPTNEDSPSLSRTRKQLAVVPFKRFVADIIDVLVALSLQKVVVVCFDIALPYALAAASEQSNRFRGVISINGSPDGVQSEQLSRWSKALARSQSFAINEQATTATVDLLRDAKIPDGIFPVPDVVSFHYVEDSHGRTRRRAGNALARSVTKHRDLQRGSALWQPIKEIPLQRLISTNPLLFDAPMASDFSFYDLCPWDGSKRIANFVERTIESENS